MSKSKNPPFHALTLFEWLESTKNLTYSKIRAYYYLLLCCPFGDCDLELKARDLAKKIGISRTTLSDAIASLEFLGYLTVNQAAIPPKGRCLCLSPLISSLKPLSISLDSLDFPCAPNETAISYNGKLHADKFGQPLRIVEVKR